MKSQILSYLRYNVWANQTLIDYLKNNLSDVQIAQEIVSSFPSVRLTMLHIWDAEVLWQLRLQGISLKEFPSKSFQGDNTEMFQRMMETSQEFVDTISTQSESYFLQNHSFMTISYGETTQSAYDMLHHCMNHSTFHRGQVIMMLRQLGLTNPPHLDFMLWKIRGNA